jgi:hypothetical protein
MIVACERRRTKARGTVTIFRIRQGNATRCAMRFFNSTHQTSMQEAHNNMHKASRHTPRGTFQDKTLTGTGCIHGVRVTVAPVRAEQGADARNSMRTVYMRLDRNLKLESVGLKYARSSLRGFMCEVPNLCFPSILFSCYFPARASMKSSVKKRAHGPEYAASVITHLTVLHLVSFDPCCARGRRHLSTS